MRAAFSSTWLVAVGLVSLWLGAGPVLAHSGDTHHTHDVNFGAVTLHADRLEFSNAPSVPIRLVDQYQNSENNLINVYQVVGQPAVGLCDDGSAVYYVTAQRSAWDGHISIDFYGKNRVPLRDNEINRMTQEELNRIAPWPCNTI